METTENFITLAIREFRRLKKLSDDAVTQISQEAFFNNESSGDNSIAILYKHMAGNMKSRWTDFLNSDGEKPDRQRDFEFIITETDCYESVLKSWENAWAILFDSLSSLETTDLAKTVKIRGEDLSVLQAITRQLIHYSYHVGQIVYLAKHLTGDQWQSLSIPVGKSAEFNKAPKKYIEK